VNGCGVAMDAALAQKMAKSFTENLKVVNLPFAYVPSFVFSHFVIVSLLMDVAEAAEEEP